MICIYHCFRIHAAPDKIHKALTQREGLAGWWTKNVEGEGIPGSIFTFRFSSGAFNKMKIKKLGPHKVEWECVDGHEEWVGTSLVFEFREEDDGSKVCFSHSGWRELTEYVGECSFHWAYYMQSLQTYCETGEGTPNSG